MSFIFWVKDSFFLILFIMDLQYILIALVLITALYLIFSNKKEKITFSSTSFLDEKKNDFNFNLINKYYKSRILLESNYFQIISEKISNDLDLDFVFKKIDRTISIIGQQYLYYKTRVIKKSQQELESFSILTDYFIENKNNTLLTIKELSSINSHDAYFFEELINNEVPINKHILKNAIFLNILLTTLVILSFFFHIFFLGVFLIFCINLFLHYKNKSSIDFYLNNLSEFSKTLNVAKKIFDINSFLKIHFKNLDFIIPLSEFNKKVKFIVIEKYLRNEYLIIFWLIFELLKITLNIEIILFNSLMLDINKYKTQMNNLFIFIGEIDSSISVSTLRQNKQLISKPVFSSTSTINLTNLYHPLIHECVKNSIHLNNKSVLLTGSNMSGKTTFIRAFAINSIYSQTLNIAFADKYESSFFKIFTSIRNQDNINDSKSFYLDEVLSIKEFIDSLKSNEPHLFILDEIFKGTNTAERIAISKAVLSYLNSKNNLVFVSTHDLELADLLIKDNYDLYHFSEDVTNETLKFNYKIKSGKLTSRNAIKILNMYNYPKEIISEANYIYNNFTNLS